MYSVPRARRLHHPTVDEDRTGWSSFRKAAAHGESLARDSEEVVTVVRLRKPSPREGSKPKVYVTHKGGRYVNADELLRSPEVIEAIDAMAQIAERAGPESGL